MDLNNDQEEKSPPDRVMTNSEMSLSCQEVSVPIVPIENDEASEESDEVLEAATIYVLMSKQFRSIPMYTINIGTLWFSQSTLDRLRE